MNAPTETTAPKRAKIDQWTLVRDVAVLQVKLIADGLRDLVLVPASIVAGIVSLVGSRDGKPGPQFYNLLRLGKRSEKWIDLFGAHARFEEDTAAAEPRSDANIDDLLQRVESFVVAEYQRGEVTAQAKAGIDKALAAVRERRARQRTR